MLMSRVFLLVASCLNLVMALRVPLHAWDSHIHIIDPEKYPLDPDRDYTPKLANATNATEVLVPRGIEHATIVLPSVYGYNNSILIDALKFFKGQYRGIAVVDPDNISQEELDEFHAVGVRGVRVNYGNGGDEEEIIEAVKKNAAICKPRNWVLQVWVPLSAFVALHDVIPDLGVTVVMDHFAHAEAGSKTNNTLNTIDPYLSKGFPEVIDLLQRKLLYVKISAPYQNSADAPLYDDLRVVAQALMNNGPEQVVYGSDWPHAGSKVGNAISGGRLNPQDYRVFNDDAFVDTVKLWAETDTQIQRIFVDNPRRLWQWYEDS